MDEGERIGRELEVVERLFAEAEELLQATVSRFEEGRGGLDEVEEALAESLVLYEEVNQRYTVLADPAPRCRLRLVKGRRELERV